MNGGPWGPQQTCKNRSEFCTGSETVFTRTSDEDSSPKVVLVLEYVAGPPLLRVAPGGTCAPMAEPLARRAFADVFQVLLQALKIVIMKSA